MESWPIFVPDVDGDLEQWWPELSIKTGDVTSFAVWAGGGTVGMDTVVLDESSSGPVQARLVESEEVDFRPTFSDCMRQVHVNAKVIAIYDVKRPHIRQTFPIVLLDIGIPVYVEARDSLPSWAVVGNFIEARMSLLLRYSPILEDYFTHAGVQVTPWRITAIEQLSDHENLGYSPVPQLVWERESYLMCEPVV